MVYRNKTTVDVKELSVGILYANSREEKANILKEELEAKGMTVKMQASDSLIKNYIAIHNLDVAGDIITELKKEIPQLKDKHTIYDPIGINRTGKDMTIVISDL